MVTILRKTSPINPFSLTIVYRKVREMSEKSLWSTVMDGSFIVNLPYGASLALCIKTFNKSLKQCVIYSSLHT